MLAHPFEDANPVIKAIKNQGYTAYYVGGCIRDYLLKQETNDIDIATSALPEDIQKIFEKVIPVGVDHGTVLVRYNHVSYEVTTYKSIINQFNKNVSYDIKDDLAKRDFTINALAMDEQGEIIDMYDGESDIKNKLIRAVGLPDDRLNEDPLRIIRALRFSSQLNFEIETDTLKSMMKLKHKISLLSVERITTEMNKFFTGKNLDKGLKYLLQTKIYTELPIFKSNKDLIKSLPSKLKPFNRFSEVISFFYMIDNRISINEWIKSWKLSNETKKESVNLTKALTSYNESGINAMLLYKLETDLIKSFVYVANLYFKANLKVINIVDQKNALPITSRQELNINGNDITKLYPQLKKGKWIEDVLSSVEKEVLNRRLHNDNNTIKEWIKCNRLEIN